MRIPHGFRWNREKYGFCTSQSEGVELLAGMEAQVVKGQHVPQIIHRPDSVKKGSFVFENTPLPKVLTELSHYYGVKLVADRTDKRLTAISMHTVWTKSSR